MQYDPNNHIVKLLAEAMQFEGEGKNEEALKLSLQAWTESTNHLERFSSAHYLARHQDNLEDKLNWDKTALAFALKIDDESVKAAYPSLYLNIAKGYEDLNDFHSANEHYQHALSYSSFLPDDGYGNMIRSGIASGLKRVKRPV